MDITVTLDRLLQLQTVDSGIAAMESELDLLPRNLEAARLDEEAVAGQRDEAKKRVDEVLKRRRELEQQIESIGATINKFETQKLNVKTNDEYHAINSQIAHEKGKRSALEDEVLLSFDDEESATQKVNHLDIRLAEVKKQVATRQQELEARGTEDRKRLEELRVQREALVTEVDPRMLSRYEQLRPRKNGVAVTSVIRGSCGGCFSALPPQVSNEVRKRNAEIYCEFCGRFLINEPAGAGA